MADETFAYTGATTLTFDVSGHLNDDGETFAFNQISDVTIGGVRMTSNLGEHLNQYEYNAIIYLSHETSTDWANVLSFFGTTYVNGGVNTFTWTDHASTAMTVQLIAGSIKKKNLGGTYCQVTFLLEEYNG